MELNKVNRREFLKLSGLETASLYSMAAGIRSANAMKNTPEAFRQSLAEIKSVNNRRERTLAPHIIGINAFNEWTEGSYLEPDTQYDMKYLQAIREVFEG